MRAHAPRYVVAARAGRQGAGNTLDPRGRPSRRRASRSQVRGPPSASPMGMSIASSVPPRSARAMTGARSSTTVKRSADSAVSDSATSQPPRHPSIPISSRGGFTPDRIVARPLPGSSGIVGTDSDMKRAPVRKKSTECSRGPPSVVGAVTSCTPWPGRHARWPHPRRADRPRPPGSASPAPARSAPTDRRAWRSPGRAPPRPPAWPRTLLNSRAGRDAGR